MKLALSFATVAFAAVTALAVTGCGKSPKTDTTTTTSADTKAASTTPGVKGSCNLRKDTGTCSQETDKSDDMGLAKGLCEALKGTWSNGPCPQDDKTVGNCADKDGSMTFYYADGDAPRDLEDAKSSCEVLNEGKFTALMQPKPAATTAVAPAKQAKAAAAKPGPGTAKKK